MSESSPKAGIRRELASHAAEASANGLAEAPPVCSDGHLPSSLHRTDSHSAIEARIETLPNCDLPPFESRSAAAENTVGEAGGASLQRPMENPHKGKTGFTRLRNAVRYSIDGLRAALRNEDAFRQEILAFCVLCPVALLLAPNGIGRALMIGSMLIVLIVELLNSAIEAAVDRISFEDHRLAKRAKDIGSAAVFMSLINVFVIWGLILL